MGAMNPLRGIRRWRDKQRADVRQTVHDHALWAEVRNEQRARSRDWDVDSLIDADERALDE